MVKFFFHKPVNTSNSFSQLPVFQLCEALTVGKRCTFGAETKIQNKFYVNILLFTHLEHILGYGVVKGEST